MSAHKQNEEKKNNSARIPINVAHELSMIQQHSARIFNNIQYQPHYVTCVSQIK